MKEWMERNCVPYYLYALQRHMNTRLVLFYSDSGFVYPLFFESIWNIEKKVFRVKNDHFS